MKGVASWIMVVGSVMLGIIIFSLGSGLIMKHIKLAEKQGIIEQTIELHQKLKRICISGGLYELYSYEMNIPDSVKAVYVANDSHDLPPDMVSVLISKGNSSTGNHVCIQFFDEDLPKCLEIGCNISLTYMGSPSMQKDLPTLIARLIGSPPVYEYRILINKTDEHLVTAKAVRKIGEGVPKSNQYR